MKEYYDLLLLFGAHDDMSRFKLLNHGALGGKRKYTEADIDRLEKELHYIKKVRENEYGDPVYVITEAGKNYRDK